MHYMRDIKIMTYNMLHAPGDRTQRLSAIIKESGADVVAAQEVDDPTTMAKIAAECGMAMVIGTSNGPESDGESDDEPPQENLAVLSKLPIARMVVHPGDRSIMFRPVLEVWVRGPSSGRVIGLFVVHLRAVPGPPGEQFRMREASAVQAVLSDRETPHILLGDFNAWLPGQAEAWGKVESWAPHLPDDHRAAVQGKVLGLFLNAGYKDALDTGPGRRPGSLRNVDGPGVDHILVTPNLLPWVTGSKMLRSEAASLASDHYPSWITVACEV